MAVRADRFVSMVLSATLVSGVLAGVGGAAVADAFSVPSPKLAKFIPVNYRVTLVKKVNLDGSRVPQEAVTAVGPVNSTSFATSLVLVLAWDSYAKRWTSVYDTLDQSSWQTSSQFGRGPGLVDVEGTGPEIKAIHDQPHGRTDLVYWLDSVAGNEGDLIVGVVHFKSQIATQVFSFDQSYGHVFSMDQPSKATTGATVIGNEPHQRLKITLPWLTPADSASQAARMYYITLAAQSKDFDSYVQVFDDQSYVGVALNSSSVVNYVDPESPANGLLHVGDVIEGVVGSSLHAKDETDLIGPKVVEEVAQYQPGQIIKLSILRGGQPLTETLQLAQWPIDQSSDYITTSTGNYDLM
jgi:hypothetical protein